MLVQHDYPVGPGVLADLLTDAAYLGARSARFGGAGEPTVERSDDLVVVTVPRRLPLEHVPTAFRRFVGDGLVVESARWTRAARTAAATWTVETGHAPIDLGGTQSVVVHETGCRHVVTAEIRVHLPVGRARLSRLVETHLADLVRAEQRFAADWLAGGGR